MKNKIISLVLAMMVFMYSSLQADMFDKTSSTSYSTWKDPASNISYTNFGSVSFKFKKNVTSFAPWMKIRPPGVKAGCGGVSLDAGFAAFLDLKTIGKQLEQAISSVGMGVIVVLIQTMPSIGKAYENIQKLIRKIQSLLQNACQLTVQGLSNDPQIASTQKEVTDAISKNTGMDWFNKQTQGIDTVVDDVKDILTCNNDDHNCLANVQHLLKPGNPNTDEKNSMPKRSSLGIVTPIAESIESFFPAATLTDYTAKVDTIENVLVAKQFKSLPLLVDDSVLTAFKIRMAMFGSLVIMPGDGSDGMAGTDPSTRFLVNVQEGSEAVASNSPRPSMTAKFLEPLNSADEVAKFLIGVDENGSATTNSLKLPRDIDYVIELYCSKATQDGGASGDRSSFQYLQMKNGASDANTFEIEWEGIKKASYETILNAVDSNKYPLPPNPIGVYMPNGHAFVQMIKNYAKKEDIESYASLLARINVKYAVEALMREAKNDAINIVKGENGQAKTALTQYLKRIDGVTATVLKKIEDDSGDVVYLNNISQVFEDMKQKALQERMKRVKQ